MFSDRQEAASQLARRLKAYRGKNPLVLGIPRGAVPMAKTIATALEGEMDVVLVRKLHAPHQPEYAIGAIDESGATFLNRSAAALGFSEDYLQQEKRIQMETLRRRRSQYAQVRSSIDPAGRTVIVVDDGLATGATMIAALQSVRARHPARLICAVPVAPQDTLARVAEFADEVVCIETPDFFQAVGDHYRHFPQIEDNDVVELLKAS